MWQRFTEKARRVILLGQEEAGKMNSGHVGTEHLLLGLVRENEGVAVQILQRHGLSQATIRRDVETKLDAPVYGEPKLTPQSKRVLELAADEARRMRHTYIGTEHLLLALIRQKDGIAAQILMGHGLNLQDTRTEIASYLNSLTQETEAEKVSGPITPSTPSVWKRISSRLQRR